MTGQHVNEILDLLTVFSAHREGQTYEKRVLRGVMPIKLRLDLIKNKIIR